MRASRAMDIADAGASVPVAPLLEELEASTRRATTPLHPDTRCKDDWANSLTVARRLGMTRKQQPAPRAFSRELS